MTKVTLLVKGLLVLSAQEGQQVGKVGIPKRHPGNHDLTIRVTRQPPTGGVQVDPPIPRGQIQNLLDLDIINPTVPRITIRNKARVARKDPPQNTDSFNWFVDLERPEEMYREPIGVIAGELMPVLEFNSGELYTVQPLSRNFLLVQRGLFSIPEPLGRVAITIGIDFTSERAVFRNGSRPVFDSADQPGTNYMIELTHDPKHHPAIVTDANYYNTALGPDIAFHERILFMSLNEVQLLRDRLERAAGERDNALRAALENLIRILDKFAGPEAACFPAYLSKSNL
jgi:hypothetical protein